MSPIIPYVATQAYSSHHCCHSSTEDHSMIYLSAAMLGWAIAFFWFVLPEIIQERRYKKYLEQKKKGTPLPKGWDFNTNAIKEIE